MTINDETLGLSLENKNIEQKMENEKKEDIISDNELEKIKEKLTLSENQYLRLMADYQNLQKRTAQEKEDIYKFAGLKTIESLMPAIDTFEYAKQSIKPDSKTEKLIEDFNLVFESLLKCLKEIGLEPIEETGIPFNPVYHEPLQQIPTNELPEHTVMQILKKGYVLNKKVVRPALVAVSVKEGNSNS